MRFYKRLHAFVAAFALVPFAADSTNAQHLAVDFGNGINQSGFQAFPVIAGPDAYVELPNAIGAGGVVGVRIQSVPAVPVFEWRIRDEIVGGDHLALNGLLQDFVFVWRQTSLVITISGLAAGEYSFSSYHHDTQFSDHGAVDLQITDATGTRMAAVGVVQTSGTEPSLVAKVTTSVSVGADGLVRCVLAVDPDTGNAAVLNGVVVAGETPIGVEATTWGAIKCLFATRD